MKIHKCFFCGKDILTIEAETYITGSERQEFYKEYGYIRYLVGKIGEKVVCNCCSDDIYELISGDVRDTIADMDDD